MGQRANRVLFDASGIGGEAMVRVYLGPEGYNNERYVREHEVRFGQALNIHSMPRMFVDWLLLKSMALSHTLPLDWQMFAIPVLLLFFATDLIRLLFTWHSKGANGV